MNQCDTGQVCGTGQVCVLGTVAHVKRKYRMSIMLDPEVIPHALLPLPALPCLLRSCPPTLPHQAVARPRLPGRLLQPPAPRCCPCRVPRCTACTWGRARSCCATRSGRHGWRRPPYSSWTRLMPWQVGRGCVQGETRKARYAWLVGPRHMVCLDEGEWVHMDDRPKVHGVLG